MHTVLDTQNSPCQVDSEISLNKPCFKFLQRNNDNISCFWKWCLHIYFKLQSNNQNYLNTREEKKLLNFRNSSLK